MKLMTKEKQDAKMERLSKLDTKTPESESTFEKRNKSFHTDLRH